METVKTIPAPNVDAYLNDQPEKVRKALQKLRETILQAVPGAEEVISYRVPTIKYKGGLVAFAAFPKHCSLFTMSPALMGFLKEDLKLYDVSGVTIHFTPEKQLPAGLILKIVKARMRENEALVAAREQKAASRKKSVTIPAPSKNSASDGYSRKKFAVKTDSPKKSTAETALPKKSTAKPVVLKKSADNAGSLKKSADIAGSRKKSAHKAGSLKKPTANADSRKISSVKAIGTKKPTTKSVASTKSAADNSISPKKSPNKSSSPGTAVKTTR